MMDFLKAYPFITIEQYRWQLSIPEIRLMSYDASRVVYLSDKQSKKEKAKRNSINFDEMLDNEDLMADTGVPVFNNAPKQ